MGNYKFRLSDMMPNAWFYKLRDMNKPKTNQIKKIIPSYNQIPQKHYYHTTENFYGSPKNIKTFDTRFPFDPPRKSTKNRTRRKTIYQPSPKKTTHFISTNCVCKEPEYPVWLKPKTVHVRDLFDDFPSSPDQDFLEAPSSEFKCSDSFYVPHKSFDEANDESCSFISSSDIIFDKSQFELISEVGLRPIVTKPVKVKTEEESLNLKSSSTKTNKENIMRRKKNARTSSTSPATRKSVSCSRRVKVKGSTKNKVASKKRGTRAHKSVKGEENDKVYAESFVIVKSSLDPEHDFKESMMEMIVENNIKASKELEDLLACYLSLNSNQYHDLIIKAFEQIWFSIPQH